MAYISTAFPFTEYWNSTTSGRLAFIEEWLRDYIEEVIVEESQIAKSIRMAGEVATLAPTFQTQEGYPQQLYGQLTGADPYTITFSGTVMHGVTLTTNLLQQFITNGTILQKEVAGVIHEIKISAAVSGLACTCVASGNTSILVDDAPIWWDLVSTPWADTTDFTAPSAVPRKLEHTFTQIFRAHLQYTKTDENLAERLVNDPFERQFRLRMIEMSNELARAIIRNRPVYDTGSWLTGYDTSAPQFAGIDWWCDYAQGQFANPLTDMDCSDTPLTGDRLKNVMHSLVNEELAPMGRAQYAVFGHPDTMRYIEGFQQEYRRIDGEETTVGWTNDYIMLNGQKVPFGVDRYIPKSRVFVLPTAMLEYGPFKGGAPQRKEVETAGMYRQWIIYAHYWGLLPQNPRWIGRLKNIKAFDLAA